MIDQSQSSYLQRLNVLAEVDLISLDGENYLEETLQRIVEIGNQIIPSNMGVHIILWDKETEAFSVSATTIKKLTSEGFSKNARNRGGVTRHIIDTLETIVINDVAEDPFRKGRKLKGYGVRSYFGIPMVMNNEAIGVFYIFNDTPMVYLEEDIQFCSLLAKRAAAAIREARHFLRLQNKASRDGLTDLLNKSTFLEIANKLCRSSERNPIENSLVFLDIDDFKQINDKFGHTEGDRILKLVATIIRESVRDMDVAARYGGDEFMVLFPNTGTSDLGIIIQRLKNRFASTNWGLDQSVVSMSLGSATTNTLCRIDTLIEMADKKMYHKKRTGKLDSLELN